MKNISVHKYTHRHRCVRVHVSAYMHEASLEDYIGTSLGLALDLEQEGNPSDTSAFRKIRGALETLAEPLNSTENERSIRVGTTLM